MSLRELRKQKGLSLRQVEAATGVDRGSLSRYERGIETPGGLNLIRLAGFFCIPAEDVLGMVENARKERESA